MFIAGMPTQEKDIVEPKKIVHKRLYRVSSQGCHLFRRFWTCVSFNFGGLLVFWPYGRNFVTLACTQESRAHIRLHFVSELLPLVSLTDFSHQ